MFSERLSAVSSVGSEASSIFPVTRSLPGPRGPGQEPAAQSSDEFAALLDNEPAAPRAREHRNERRDDTAPANGNRRTGTTAQSRRSETSKDTQQTQPGTADETQVQEQSNATADKAGDAKTVKVAQGNATDAIQPGTGDTETASPDATQPETVEAPAAVANAAPLPQQSPVALTPVIAADAAAVAPEVPAEMPPVAPETESAPATAPAASQDRADNLATAANAAKPVMAPAGGQQQAPAEVAAGPSAGDSAAINTKPAVQPAATPPAPPQTDGAPPELAATASREPAQAPAVPVAPVAKPGASANAAASSDGSDALKIADDVVQNLGANGGAAPTGVAPVQSTAAAHAAAASAPVQPGPAAVPVAGIAVEIATQALSGKQRFEIRLDPPELGRIDVRLEIDRDGNVSSKLMVERPETLDMLRRDAAQLERALQQAGLKTSDNALEFSLRQQNPEQDRGAPSHGNARAADDEPIAADTAQMNYGRRLTLGGGIDIRI
jgi:flagellar hook-length control protein FliK